jgi:PPM family protein phosphatase
VRVRIRMKLPKLVRKNRSGDVSSRAVIIDKPMIESFGVSDAGCVRTNNEDYYLIAPEFGLYVVADGMGGAQAGEHASKLAAETVLESVSMAPSIRPETLLRAFEEANRRVLRAAATDTKLEGMGTTLVAALQSGDSLLVASVGDSRAYVLLEGDQLLVITEDQTWVHEVGRRLGLDDAALKVHPMRHVLTMAIGVSAQLRVHTCGIKVTPGMQMLLCSDGLHGVVNEEAIHATLSGSGGLEEKCMSLVQSAKQAGGPDNITAVLLRVDGVL